MCMFTTIVIKIKLLEHDCCALISLNLTFVFSTTCKKKLDKTSLT